MIADLQNMDVGILFVQLWAIFSEMWKLMDFLNNGVTSFHISLSRKCVFMSKIVLLGLLNLKTGLHIILGKLSATLTEI